MNSKRIKNSVTNISKTKSIKTVEENNTTERNENSKPRPLKHCDNKQPRPWYSNCARAKQEGEEKRDEKRDREREGEEQRTTTR